MKTLREYIDQLDEISRRDFLKGAGAAVGAAALGGANQAKADWVNRGMSKDSFDDTEYGSWDNQSTDGTATLILGNQKYGGQKDWNSFLHLQSNIGAWRPFRSPGHQGPVSSMWGRIRLDNGPVMNIHLGFTEGNNWTSLLISPEGGSISDRNFIQAVASAEKVRIQLPARRGGQYDQEVLEFRKGQPRESEEDLEETATPNAVKRIEDLINYK